MRPALADRGCSREPHRDWRCAGRLLSCTQQLEGEWGCGGAQDLAVHSGFVKAIVAIARSGSQQGKDAAAAALAELSASGSKLAMTVPPPSTFFTFMCTIYAFTLIFVISMLKSFFEIFISIVSIQTSNRLLYCPDCAHITGLLKMNQGILPSKCTPPCALVEGRLQLGRPPIKLRRDWASGVRLRLKPLYLHDPAGVPDRPTPRSCACVCCSPWSASAWAPWGAPSSTTPLGHLICRTGSRSHGCLEHHKNRICIVCRNNTWMSEALQQYYLHQSIII